MLQVQRKSRIQSRNMWMSSNAPIAMQQEEKIELLKNHQPHITLLFLDHIRLFFRRWLLTFMQTRKMSPDHPSGQIDQSSIITNTLKEETGRSQQVLPNRIPQLEEKCDVVHEQQAALRWTIETQIVPYMSTMSELLVDVCQQLATAKVITLTDQQQTRSHRLRHLPTTAQASLSPSPFSRSFSTVYPRPVRQQTCPFEVNCSLFSHSASLSSQWTQMQTNSILQMKLEHDQQLLTNKIFCLQGWWLIIN